MISSHASFYSIECNSMQKFLKKLVSKRSEKWKKNTQNIIHVSRLLQDDDKEEEDEVARIISLTTDSRPSPRLI